MAEYRSDVQAVFEHASEYAKGHLGSFSTDEILKLYGLYKQATEGTNTQPKPNFWNITAKQKWEAWSVHGSKAREKAMEEYVAIVTSLDPTWMDQPTSNGSWVHHSTLLGTDDVVPDAEKDLFYWVKDNDLKAVQRALTGGADLKERDEDGLSLLHWAADRGHVGMLEVLLDAGVAVDLQDGEGQTALHYAASCGHVPAVAALLQAGASHNIPDSDGNRPRDVAASSDVVKLLDAI